MANPVLQMLVNYQNGISREITGNGNEAKGNNGGNGAIRLITIDPDNKPLSTETYFTVFDDYLDGFRAKPELDRDGLTGSYRGHQEVFKGIDLGAPTLSPWPKRVTTSSPTLLRAPRPPMSRFPTPSRSAGKRQELVWPDEDGDVVANGKAPRPRSSSASTS